MIILKNKISLALITLGIFILLFKGNYFNTVFVPGQISASHSSFSEDCIKCHDNDFKNFKINIHQKNNEKCTSCHNIKAHQVNETNQLKCTECHTEHKGNEKLNFDNDKCQTCHQVKFNSFEKGHPKFKNYPYQRRTQIIFDHQTHLRKYFNNKDINCNTCHKVDNSGERILTLDFKTSCSNCHLKEVNGEGQSQTGIAFISMPQIDYKALGLTSWPVEADGEITEFLKVMLAADPEIKNLIEQTNDLDLKDLSQATEEQKISINKIISSMKNFYLELYAQGHSAIRKRLGNLEGAEVDNLVSGFPLSMFRKALKDWLPGALKKSYESEEELSSEELMQSGGWYRSSYSIYYRPKGHADVFIKSWMDLPENKRLKKEIFNPTAPGRCGYCHSVDYETKVNWHSNTIKNKLIHFKHENHFLVIKGCNSCHSLNPEYRSQYDQPDPRKFISNFLDIENKLCTECHTKNKAMNNCLECHNYHER